MTRKLLFVLFAVLGAGLMGCSASSLDADDASHAGTESGRELLAPNPDVEEIVILPGTPRSESAHLCTDYCKGTRAGYDWARTHAIRNEAACNLGEKVSYSEGCKLYVKLSRFARN